MSSQSLVSPRTMVQKFWCHAIVTALALAYGASAAAQTPEEKSVLFDDTHLDSGYTSIAVKSGKAPTKSGAFIGATGGWRLTESLSFGIEGEVLGAGVHEDEPKPSTLGLFYVGAFGEAALMREQLVSVLGRVGVGYGQLSAKLDAATAQEDPGIKVYQTDGLAYVEPALGVLLHLTRRLDLGAIAGYRAVSGHKLGDVAASDLRGATAGVMLRGNF